MKKAIISAIFIFSCMILSENIMAQGRGMGPGMMRDGFDEGPPPMKDRPFFGDPDQMKEKLKLSDSQIEAISNINEKMKDEFKKFRGEIRPKMQKLRRLIIKDDVKIDEARALLKEISEIEIEIRLLKIKHRLEIEKVLTPEQKSKMKKEVRKRHRHND